MNKDAFAANLKKLRTAAGLTLNEVGALVGKSGKTVSSWETGRTNPDKYTVSKLCEIYHVDNLSADIEEDGEQQAIINEADIKTKELTELVKAKIREKYKSLRAFAAKIGMPYSTILSGLERGLGGMTASNVMLICKELGIDLNEWAEGQEKEKAPGDDTDNDRVEAERQMLLSQISDLMDQMDMDQLSRLDQLTRWAALPQERYSALAHFAEMLENLQ
jgi:transcriptional regulator with XRE-family HTH domain